MEGGGTSKEVAPRVGALEEDRRPARALRSRPVRRSSSEEAARRLPRPLLQGLRLHVVVRAGVLRPPVRPGLSERPLA